MTTQVTVAIIAAAVSFAAMLFTFFTAKKSKSMLAEVEDRAKRSELIRAQALKSIEEILSNLTDIYFAIGNLRFLLKQHGDSVPTTELLELMAKIADARGKLNRVRFISAPYLKHELTEEVDVILQHTTSLNFTDLQDLEESVLMCMNDISAHAKQTYLF